MFADDMELNTAGHWNSQCLPAAHPSIRTTGSRSGYRTFQLNIFEYSTYLEAFDFVLWLVVNLSSRINILDGKLISPYFIQS